MFSIAATIDVTHVNSTNAAKSNTFVSIALSAFFDGIDQRCCRIFHAKRKRTTNTGKRANMRMNIPSAAPANSTLHGQTSGKYSSTQCFEAHVVLNPFSSGIDARSFPIFNQKDGHVHCTPSTWYMLFVQNCGVQANTTICRCVFPMMQSYPHRSLDLDVQSENFGKTECQRKLTQMRTHFLSAFLAVSLDTTTPSYCRGCGRVSLARWW